MRKSISYLAITAVICAGFSSCIPLEENEGPEVFIYSPSAEDSPFVSGEPITIDVGAKDDIDIHEVVVSVVREHDSKEVYLLYGHSHGLTYRYQIDTTFITTTVSDFTIKATVSDHEGGVTVKTETFQMQPS